jgi:ribose transport system ATP-binding protein
MANDVLVEMRGIHKQFPGVYALKDAKITIRKGEVHGLVGENGAGKSTLMKVLAGIHHPDRGEIIVKGKKVNYHSPRDALDDGLVMIHQELNLLPHLSVADNIFIGREPMKGIMLDDDRKITMTKELLESLHLHIDPKEQVFKLTVAIQQMIEIAKALSFNAEVVIMDEPTAALTNFEVENLFAFIQKMQERGLGVIYISHRLEEIKQITNKITVMRDGQFIDTLQTNEVELDRVIGLMVGRVIYEKQKLHSMVAMDAPEVLRVEKLNSLVVHDVSFSLKKGEILGFAGLMGAGRTETMQLIFGAAKKTSGKIFLHSNEVEIKSPEDAVKNGIGYLSEDRKTFGLVAGLSVSDNIVLSCLESFVRNGVINHRKINAATIDYVNMIGIKTPSIKQLVHNLSGGNQQKVVVAKWLIRNSDILIFDEPTRGIDVGAKNEIYKLMNDLVEEGKSIIMISSELPELFRMSDRIVVMCEGRKIIEFNIEDATQETIMAHAIRRNNNG